MYIRTRGTLTILPLALAALISGCDSDPTNPQTGDDRTYGAAQPLGNGTARTNVEFDGEDPFEIGVAISETAMESVGQNMVMLRLALPEDAPEPYTFAMLDWNPHGHEPDGIYNLPHFDFHFYITPEAEVDAIVPTDPNYATRANNLPAGALVPQFHAVLSAPGSPPATVAVPRMGVHWSDVRSPELQNMMQNPAGYAPFTKTFIYGSWDGEFTFLEPMITRAYLQAKPNEVVQISQPADVSAAGHYPEAYRITYDATTKEYRVGLTQLIERN